MMALPNFAAQSMSALQQGLGIGQTIMQQREAQRRSELEQQLQPLRLQQMELANQLAQEQVTQAPLVTQSMEMQNQMTQSQIDRTRREDEKNKFLQNSSLLLTVPFDQRQQVLDQMAVEYKDDKLMMAALTEFQGLTSEKEQNEALFEVIGALSGVLPGQGRDMSKIIEKVDPDNYEPASFQQFMDTGNYSVLKPKKMFKDQLEEQKIQLELSKRQDELRRKQLADATKAKDTIKIAQLEQMESQNAINNIDKLIGQDLDLIYGKEEEWMPDILRSQEGVDLQATRENIVATLKLAQAGKLKGQGSVTENERKMLGDAATLLGNELISSEEALAELQRIRPIFESALAANQETLSQAQFSLNQALGAQQQSAPPMPVMPQQPGAQQTGLAPSTLPQVGTGQIQPVPQQIPEGATATNPQTGEKIIFTNGQWVRANE